MQSEKPKAQRDFEAQKSPEASTSPEKEETINSLFEETTQAEEMQGELEEISKQIELLSGEIEKDKLQLSESRKKLDLPDSDETDPSVVAQKEKIKELENKKTTLENELKKFAGTEEIIEIETSLPADILKNFNPGKILEHGKQRFKSFVEHTKLRALISYIESGGIKIEETKEIPAEWKEKIRKEKEEKKEYMTISPKLYFLTNATCSEIAMKELLARIEKEKTQHQD